MQLPVAFLGESVLSASCLLGSGAPLMASNFQTLRQKAEGVVNIQSGKEKAEGGHDGFLEVCPELGQTPG